MNKPSVPITAAIIPARSGSKGIPHKNIAALGKKPLIYYTIRAALESKFIQRVFVSTDSVQFANIASDLGAEVPFLRPEHLSGDRVPLTEVLSHTTFSLEDQENIILDPIVTLLPTNPLRSAEHIDEAIRIFKETKADALNSMHRVKERIHQLCFIPETNHIGDNIIYPFEHRKELRKKALYVANGAVTILSRQRLKILHKKYFHLLPERPVVSYIMEELFSLDINTPHDLWLAQELFNLMQKRGRLYDTDMRQFAPLQKNVFPCGDTQNPQMK
ncbi:cytidylyltransferase domain-containing protein [Thermodesulfobacteriota bacterium]